MQCFELGKVLCGGLWRVWRGRFVLFAFGFEGLWLGLRLIVVFPPLPPPPIFVPVGVVSARHSPDFHKREADFSYYQGEAFSGGSGKTIEIWDWDIKTKTKKLKNTLEEHTRDVSSLSWHPVTKQLASGSDDNTIKIWDTNTGKCLLTLEAPKEAVWSLSWHPDGQHLVSGDDNNNIRIWELDLDSDTKTAKCVQTLGNNDHIRSVSWNSDGSQFASAGNDANVRIWDVKKGK